MTRAIADISCGYEGTNDLERLRTDSACKLACGRLPDSGIDLCSQPTFSRLENPLARAPLSGSAGAGRCVAVELCRAAESVTPDIDRFLTIHIYDAATGRPVAVILRPGKTPTGKQIRGHLHLSGTSAPAGRPPASWSAATATMAGRRSGLVREQCARLSLPSPDNKVLQRLVDEAADDIRTRRAG
ncbi:transposase [Mesorhizobium sp.]|uniref:transposase n=1 Tax=Mesorhizobium sp. TaxID=1871066 RepID=UPI000FE57648|nr:transposase [Mesorhizobium sp.]RWI18150.1 MAG: hypothetical protein EOQ94_27440 [Mesorhizobium sp.]TIQ94152.1 MAG: hypothetical protein E5X36_27430 [Mesorhizobium sp.]